MQYEDYLSIWEGEQIDAGIAHAQYAADYAYPAGACVIHSGHLWRNTSGAATTGVEPGTNYNVWNVNYSNQNLLDNPWFTVNQRGVSGVVSNAYGFDRWVGTYDAVKNLGRIHLRQRNDMAIQRIENFAALVGKTVTASVKYGDGRIDSGTLTVVDDGSTRYFFTTDRVHCMLTRENDFECWANAECNLVAVKLEYGSISTLANDSPPNYADELAKCQRYYEKIPFSIVYGVADTTTRVWRTSSISLKTTKRVYNYSIILFPNPSQKIECIDLATNQSIQVTLAPPVAFNSMMLCPAFTGQFVVGRQYQFIVPDNAIAVSADL